MLKYVNYDIVFQEYPDEVTLAINLSLCPNRCPGCHSAYLQQDMGEELTAERLFALLSTYAGEITCVGFMGGDNDPAAIMTLARHVKESPATKHVKVGWYSGRPQLPKAFDAAALDYVKLGPYIAAQGPLSSPTTNQHLYRIDHSDAAGPKLVDITQRFWRTTVLSRE